MQADKSDTSADSGGAAPVVEGAEQSGDAVPILQQTVSNFSDFLVGIVPNLIIACIVIFITWLISKYVVRLGAKMVKETDIRPRLRDLMTTLSRLFVWTTGLMIAAVVVIPGLTPASLVTGLGFGAVAASFAFKDIMENLLAGIFIMLRDKMRIGDQIECNDISGKVEHITLRETHIRKASGEITLVPNSVLFKNPVEIFTDAKSRRYECVTGVSYEADLEQATSLIQKAVEQTEGVLADKGVDVFADKFGGSFIGITIRWWADSKARAKWETRDRTIRAIKITLEQAGIEFSDPSFIELTRQNPIGRTD